MMRWSRTHVGDPIGEWRMLWKPDNAPARWITYAEYKMIMGIR